MVLRKEDDFISHDLNIVFRLMLPTIGIFVFILPSKNEKWFFFNWLAFSFLLTIPSSYDFYLWVYSTHTKLPAFEQFWNILDLFLQLIFCSYLLFFSFFASFPFLQLLSCFTCVRWIDWGPCSSGKATLT